MISFSILTVTVTIFIQFSYVKTETETGCLNNTEEWDLSLEPFPGLKEYIEDNTKDWIQGNWKYC
jgi:hypothetical protein